jgi:hypothetical protein
MVVSSSPQAASPCKEARVCCRHCLVCSVTVISDASIHPSTQPLTQLQRHSLIEPSIVYVGLEAIALFSRRSADACLRRCCCRFACVLVRFRSRIIVRYIPSLSPRLSCHTVNAGLLAKAHGETDAIVDKCFLWSSGVSED